MSNDEPDDAPVVPLENAPKVPDEDPLFAAFWDAYPRKVGKGHARSRWRRTLRLGVDPQQIIAAAERFRDDCLARDTPRKYIPHPIAWLSGERYADEPAEPGQKPGTSRPTTSLGSLNHEQLLAAVIRLSQDQAQPVTAAAEIIDLIRTQLRLASPEAVITVSPERVQVLAQMPYQDYLQTAEWQERRKAALKRAGYRCQVCDRERLLHVHHRTYVRRGNELPGDLTVLCNECHALFHGKGLITDEPSAA